MLRHLKLMMASGVMACSFSAHGAPALGIPYQQQNTPMFMKDEHGRNLILHGVNATDSAKHSPDRMGPFEERDYARLRDDWGFNTVRFIIVWDNLMPSPGVINEQYLDDIALRMDWMANSGQYAVVDMHQNLYGKATSPECGTFFSGAPAWATYTDGKEDTTCDGGLSIVNSPATVAAYDNFWAYDDHPELQDYFIDAWQAVATRLKGHPALLAYNVFNEPRPGTLTESVFSNFNQVTLPEFYERWIAGMREIDQDVYLQLEPASIPANFGIQANLRIPSDPREGESKIVYSPHVYPLLSTENITDNITLDSPFLSIWNTTRVNELNDNPMPLYVGEWGARYLGTSVSSKDLTLLHMDLMDTMLASWAVWVYDPDVNPDETIAGRGWRFVEKYDYAETPMLDYMVRPYPQKTAGTPKNLDFALSTRDFEYRYEHDPSIGAPTEIYVPIERIYDGSYTVEVTGGAGFDGYQLRVNPDTEVMSVFVDSEVATSVTVRIKDVDTEKRHYRTFASNRIPGGCMAMETGVNGEVFNGANVFVAACNDDDLAQQWYYEHKSGVMVNAHGLCLDIAQGNIAFGNPMQAWHCNGTNAQRFTYIDNFIYARASGKAFDIAPWGGNIGVDMRVRYGVGTLNVTHDSHRMTASEAPTGIEDYVTFVNESHNNCIEVEGNSSQSNTRIQTSTCDPAQSGQLFYHDPVIGTIRSLSGTCLDTAVNGSNNGAKMRTGDCSGSASQQFDNDGYDHWALRNRPSKRIHSPRGSNGYHVITYSHSRSGRDNYNRREMNYEAVTQNDDLFFQLRSGKNGKCLAAGSGNTNPAPQTKLQVQNCWLNNTNPAQLFYYSNTTKQLITKGGLCVDWGGTSVNNADIKVQECRPTRNQRFYFNNRFGTLQHTSGIAGIEFAIDGTSVNDGSRVVLWTADGGNNQRWYKRTPAFVENPIYPGSN